MPSTRSGASCCPTCGSRRATSGAMTSTAAIGEQETASISGRISVPLYQGGETQARVRQAKHTHVSRLQEIEQARARPSRWRSTAWSRLAAARAQIRSDHGAGRGQLGSRSKACARRRRSASGRCSTCSTPSRNCSTPRCSWSITRRELVVAAYTVLSSIGRLSAERLAVTRRDLRARSALRRGAPQLVRAVDHPCRRPA